MPLVEGESLRARIDRERQLPLDDALRYAREVADALSYAHAHGVVHRDIKPENILIESDHAVVADFGIARAFASAAKGRLTGSGMSIGTPAYMSPEQAAGDRDVDGRSDLYSLGCVLYEMLAGQPPFSGATKETLVRQHIMTSPPPVSQFRPAVPPAVNDALMRALAKAPADRFNSGSQFAAAIAPSATTTTSVATPVTAARRRRWPVMAALGLMLVAAIVWLLGARKNRAEVDGRTARSIAVLPFDNIGGDTAVVPLLLGVHADIVTQLAKLAGLAVTSRTSALTYRNSDKSDRVIASELGVSSLLRGSIQRSGGQVHLSVQLTDAPNGKLLWAENYDRPYTAQNLVDVQGDIARQVAAALRVQLSAQQQRDLNRSPTTSLEALDEYYRALAMWDDRGREDQDTIIVRHLERALALDSTFAAAWGMLAQAHAWIVRGGRSTDTMPAWSALQRVRRLAPGSLDATRAAGYYRYYALGDFVGALAELSLVDSLAPGSSELILLMGLLERRIGRWPQAVEHIRRAAELDRRDAVIAYNLAETYLYMRNFAEARRWTDRALMLGPASFQLVRLDFVLHVATGDTAGARAVLQRNDFLPARAQHWLAGDLALYARDFATTLQHYQSVEARFATFMHRELQLALTAAASGDSALARRHADALVRSAEVALGEMQRRGGIDAFGLRSKIESQMAVALALRGARDAAVRLAVASARRYPLERDAIDAGWLLNYLALTYMLADRRAEAITVLDSLLRVPSELTPARLRLDPRYDGLRNEAGFQQLLASGR
jgi:serine/threonine-protein kinase